MFQPTSSFDRHQKYLEAFTIESIVEYYQFINQFLTDPIISHHNGDDMDLFINFIFDSKFGDLHNAYCKFMLSSSSFLEISSFLNFLHEDCELFVYDFFYSLAKDYNHIIIEKVFEKLSCKLKLELLNTVCKFPEKLKGSSRLKLYAVFS